MKDIFGQLAKNWLNDKLYWCCMYEIGFSVSVVMWYWWKSRIKDSKHGKIYLFMHQGITGTQDLTSKF